MDKKMKILIKSLAHHSRLLRHYGSSINLTIPGRKHSTLTWTNYPIDYNIRELCSVTFI